jgi:8-oxo-dGTP pyrophosphatase MutT (NUDIX family)
MAKEGIGLEFTGIAVIFIPHDGKGNILLAKRSKNARDEQGTWELSGGGLKFGERVGDALKREVREEFCSELINAEFLGYRDLLRSHNGNPTHWVALDFLVEIDPKSTAIGEPHKCDEIRWVRFGEWPSPLHSQFLMTVEKNKDKLLSLV